MGDARSIVAFYEGNEDALLASNTLYLVAVPLLIAFVGMLCASCARTRRRRRRLALPAGRRASR